jgi:hypothetical protein
VAGEGIDMPSNLYRYSDPAYRGFKQRLAAEHKTLLIIGRNLFQIFDVPTLKKRSKALTKKCSQTEGQQSPKVT